MHFHQLKRREFMTLFGGAAAWPLAAGAQQRKGIGRIGFLWSGFAADDPEGQVRGNAFVQGLQELGWGVGRNLRIDYRWGWAMTLDFARGRMSWSRCSLMCCSLPRARR